MNTQTETVLLMNTKVDDGGTFLPQDVIAGISQTPGFIAAFAFRGEVLSLHEDAHPDQCCPETVRRVELTRPKPLAEERPNEFRLNYILSHERSNLQLVVASTLGEALAACAHLGKPEASSLNEWLSDHGIPALAIGAGVTVYLNRLKMIEDLLKQPSDDTIYIDNASSTAGNDILKALTDSGLPTAAMFLLPSIWAVGNNRVYSVRSRDHSPKSFDLK